MRKRRRSGSPAAPRQGKAPLADSSLFRMRSLLGYPGGKTRLAPTIIRHLPKGRHKTFVEPFFGSGAVTFALPEGYAEKFVGNDLDDQLIGFWRNLKARGCGPVSRCVRDNPSTLENRRRFTAAFRAGTSEICPYFMARRVSFNNNGKDVNISHPVGRVGARAARECPSVHRRLRSVELSSLDFREVLKSHDKKGTVVFMDPPYEGRAKGLYKFEEGTSPREVCDAARSLKHAKVLITHYPTREVKAACAGLYQKEVPHLYVSRNRNHGKVHKVRELLIANYPLR